MEVRIRPAAEILRNVRRFMYLEYRALAAGEPQRTVSFTPDESRAAHFLATRVRRESGAAAPVAQHSPPGRASSFGIRERAHLAPVVCADPCRVSCAALY
jgi:hypothetical protein